MDQSDRPESNKIEVPTAEDARNDRAEFESLAASAPNDPKLQDLKNKAELWANYIFQRAGTVPDGDPRRAVFEEYNAILEKWQQLQKPRGLP